VKVICKNPVTQRPKLSFMCIEEGEEVQAKEICNVFKKTIGEISPNI
jgi:hypothetical protein